MIRVEKLNYSFPEKDLYKNISFTIEEGQHCVLIGSNGTGKSTLIDILMNTDEYLYTGKVIKKENVRMGYVPQFVKHDKDCDLSVYDYLCQDFLRMLAEQEAICVEMETATDFDEIMIRYQRALDEFQAVDGDNYENNIRKQLRLAGLSSIDQVSLAAISGGEYKLVQIIREMMRYPDLLIMDEPDVFLDFDNIAGLRDLINSYKGTILVITHNRYLLNHCFNKILHLENADIQEYEGSYIDYNFDLLQMKVEMQEAAAKDLEEIARQQKVVERMRASATAIDNAAKGRQLKARVSLLERLEARAIKAPFVEIRQPEIHLPDLSADTPAEPATELPILSVEDYGVTFDEVLLEHVSFTVGKKDKVAIVGANGTGKTTLLRDIFKESLALEDAAPSIRLGEDARVGFLSQLHGEMLDENKTIYQEMEELGLETEKEVRTYLDAYCFPEDLLDHTIGQLSGGEKNLLQLAEISLGDANLLLLDEPTSHLDTYSQIALEKAIQEYQGAILMVSHDFYSIANCVDYIYYVEDRTVRKMSGRAFRKMIYKKHFPVDYLDLEKQKKELEMRIQSLLLSQDYEKAKQVCEQLEPVIRKMSV